MLVTKPWSGVSWNVARTGGAHAVRQASALVKGVLNKLAMQYLDFNEFFRSTSVLMPLALQQVATEPESVRWL